MHNFFYIVQYKLFCKFCKYIIFPLKTLLISPPPRSLRIGHQGKWSVLKCSYINAAKRV